MDTREGGEDVTLSSRMVIQTCEVKCLVGVYKVDKWDVAMMDTGEPNLSDHRLEYTTCVNHPYPQAIHNSFSHKLHLIYQNLISYRYVGFRGKPVILTIILD